jgi:hypothetical protein
MMDFGDIHRIELELDGLPPEVVLAGELGDLLCRQDHLLVLSHGTPPYAVTLGVPHQTAIGADRICRHRLGLDGLPCPRDGDENAASFALAAFHDLKQAGAAVRLVVMAHATTHDPNKLPGSPYCQEVFAVPTRLLLECHGSGRQRRLDIEVSAGRNLLAQPRRFAGRLAAGLPAPQAFAYTLGAQLEPGKSRAEIWRSGAWAEQGVLELPARQTTSLVEAGARGIPALHLEARPLFRRPASGKGGLTPDGRVLGQAIAAAVLTSAAGA